MGPVDQSTPQRACWTRDLRSPHDEPARDHTPRILHTPQRGPRIPGGRDHTVALVVDGAGLPKECRSGCHHTVAWFADLLAHAAVHQLGDRDNDMHMALATALDDVGALHSSTCDLQAGSPSGTIAGWRVCGDQLETVVLGDATVIVRTADTDVRASDDRLQQVLEGPMKQALDAGLSGPEVRKVRDEAAARGRNQPGGFWTCSHDIGAAREALVRSYDLDDVVGVALATDGATRGVDLLGCHEVPELLTLALEGRHRAVYEAVRASELAQAQYLARIAEKTHDDFTLVSWMP